MADAKLKFGAEEIVLGQGVTTLGRTTDNTVPFASDSNVSRYHAEIEWRGGDFWLIDLGSSNGTTVNGEAVAGDVRLNDGDEILLGGTSRAEFSFAEKKSEETSAATEREDSAIIGAEETEKNEAAEIAAAAPPAAKSRMPLMLGIAGATVGLAIVCVVGAAVYSFSGASRCEAKAVIVKPDNGETISEQTEIEVETENADCATRAIFLINGAEFASATEQPFAAELDPKQFPELADGNLQSLQIVLEDAEGNKIIQPSQISLAFETIEIQAPPPAPEDIAADPTPAPPKSGQKATLIEIREMTEKLIGEFPGTFNYNASNPQFLQEVQKKTGEYAAADFYARAAAYRDVIGVAFVQERNLDARLAFILAMSRSGFKPQKNGADEGLWRMNANFAHENSYDALCGTETLSDPAQNCASKVASLYLKALILEVFEGDVVYSVAAFGKSAQEANIWKATLPADRADFWNVVRDPKQREQIVRFFAAGIVAENPQKFGLRKDRPISELYKTLVGN